ncbi:Uncharacterised protein [uncultured archaeon]|nr:Uncharacterised protein [uncultured archaeon]
MKKLGKTFYEQKDLFLSQIISKPIFINKDKKISNAFANLQSQGKNMAIVVDDKQKFIGVISIEDLVEEIVGEIR